MGRLESQRFLQRDKSILVRGETSSHEVHVYSFLGPVLTLVCCRIILAYDMTCCNVNFSTATKVLPPSAMYKQILLETSKLKHETEWLLSSEQDRVWNLTVSQAKDLPVELMVDRVAAALQDLRQDLKQTQQDLVMCLCSAPRSPVPLLD